MEETKKKRLGLKEGDIFTIPIDEKTHGYGQIIKIPRKHVFIMLVFEGKWSNVEDVSLEDIVKNKILFLGYSQDALLYHGRWVIVGNTLSNLKSITMPYFKLGLSSEPPKLVDYKLDVIREATNEEIKLLSYQGNASPIGYQKALQAYYGLSDYDFEPEFQYKHIVSTLAKLNLLPN